MNITKIKTFLQNIDTLSINAILSTLLMTILDNYMAVGAFISFVVGTLITLLSRWDTYKQKKNSADQQLKIEIENANQIRKIELMNAELSIKERLHNLNNKE